MTDGTHQTSSLGRPLQVLLVEDDETVRARLELLLTEAQFDVYGASSARDARHMMAAIVFPIVVIDRMLGDGDGIGLLSEFRQRYSEHRVFLMLFSALDSDEERRKGVKAGADEYLGKRATDHELIARLTAARARVELRAR